MKKPFTLSAFASLLLGVLIVTVFESVYEGMMGETLGFLLVFLGPLVVALVAQMIAFNLQELDTEDAVRAFANGAWALFFGLLAIAVTVAVYRGYVPYDLRRIYEVALPLSWVLFVFCGFRTARWAAIPNNSLVAKLCIWVPWAPLVEWAAKTTGPLQVSGRECGFTVLAMQVAIVVIVLTRTRNLLEA